VLVFVWVCGAAAACIAVKKGVEAQAITCIVPDRHAAAAASSSKQQQAAASSKQKQAIANNSKQ
jgi:hypothetical protein